MIAVTLLRTVGWLARFQLGTRPVPAGPALPTPDGQLPGGLSADLALRVAAPEAVLQADELGLRVVPAGDQPLVDPGVSLLTLEPDTLVLSTLDTGRRRRVPPPGAQPDRRTGRRRRRPRPSGGSGPVPATGRITRTSDDVELDGSTLRFTVRPHALRTIGFTRTP